MNEQSQNLTRAITGPILLITIGTLFLIDRFTAFSFGEKTWPVLLIVVGALRLLGGGRRRRDYIQPPPPPGGAQ